MNNVLKKIRASLKDIVFLFFQNFISSYENFVYFQHHLYYSLLPSFPCSEMILTTNKPFYFNAFFLFVITEFNSLDLNILDFLFLFFFFSLIGLNLSCQYIIESVVMHSSMVLLMVLLEKNKGKKRISLHLEAMNC